MPTDLKDWLTLLSVNGLGPSAYTTLLQKFKSPSRVLSAPLSLLCSTPLIGPETARSIRHQQDDSWAKEQIDLAKDSGIRILTLHDEEYPPLLRQLYAPPPILYARGNIEICHAPTIAMVGSRAFTPYGRDTAQRLAGELAGLGITVVSGMATGIDTHVHRGALDNEGHTAAVLGSSLDHPYPPHNLDLFREICETGVVLSEFPLGTPPEAYNFPRRNRIISGLSLGVLVVEAGRRSGALITADHALEQNREVFAVPGPIYSGKSFGTNDLIRQGATLVRNAADILAEIQLVVRRPEHAPTQLPEPILSQEERIVFSCLPEMTPIHIDEIAAQGNLPAFRALTVLLGLELRNLVEQRPGKCFIKRIN